MNTMKKKAFSLVEILVVVTIIALLAGIAAASYSQFIRQSRDAKRKTDIEQIRSAIEMYRNFHNVYPNSITFGTGAIKYDDTHVYLSKVPDDPRPTHTYYYVALSSDQDYMICTYLESETKPEVVGTSCGKSPVSQLCTFCMGPYGEK